MKKIIAVLIISLGSSMIFAQTLVTSVEAEAGTLTGVTIASQTGSSSGSYVTGFDANGDKVDVTVNVAQASIYKLVIRYRGNQGAKVQDLYVNGTFGANISFPASTDFVDLDAGTVFLVSGTNTLSILKNWGYMDVDKFTIYTSPPNVYNVTTSLIDPQATTATKNLYAFLLSNFRKNIISGQTDDKYNNMITTAGKSPMLRDFDLLTYCPQYPYNWANGGFAFGPVDNMDAEHAIAWYNNTNKKGIVAFQWHWYSPSGGTVGTNTFNTTNTTFDITQAVIPGTQQNLDAIRDIDAIAVQLKKLSAADVPIIWRPLHEAGGAWFWWGAKGSAACKALYDILYDRLTNHHGLHNLIWVWSTPEPDWYPGNTKVDMIGYDSYPGNFNYATQKNTFDKLYSIVGGQKLIAMSENGPIPDIQKCFDSDAPWSYFMSWSDLVFSQNTIQHITDVFTASRVLTLENPIGAADPVTPPVVVPPVIAGVAQEVLVDKIKCFPNPFTDKLSIEANGTFTYAVYNAAGATLETGEGQNSSVAGVGLLRGIYIVKVMSRDGIEFFKIVKN